MSRIKNADILLEMIELVGELTHEVRQQLTYFRASVYKDETASYVDSKVERLRFVVGLFPDKLLMEPFHDFDAESANISPDHCIPGECSFTSRVTRLLENLENAMARKRKAAARMGRREDSDFALTRRIQQKKSELMSICRHGSRQWAFFQRI